MTQAATTDIVPVLQQLARGGRIEVKGTLGARPGAITFRRVRIGTVNPETIRAMVENGLLYSEPGVTQIHYDLTQKGRDALAALTGSN